MRRRSARRIGEGRDRVGVVSWKKKMNVKNRGSRRTAGDWRDRRRSAWRVKRMKLLSGRKILDLKRKDTL